MKMKIGNKEFDTEHKTYIMGILNCTPDSFSDGGRYNSIDSALRHAEQLIKDGADIIDVGGESTRPGYTLISDEEEIERVVPVIEKLKHHFDVPVSIDTYKSKVAKNAVMAGADLINDIWGCKYDADMPKVMAEYDVACCLMHNRNLAQTPYGTDMLTDMAEDLKQSIAIALASGVDEKKIMIDPGIGFAKSLEQNLLVMKHLNNFISLGFPVLLGTSRKSMIGLTLDLPVDQRLEGTIATSVIGVMEGCSFIRVHDVLENKRAVMMAEAIRNAGKGQQA